MEGCFYHDSQCCMHPVPYAIIQEAFMKHVSAPGSSLSAKSAKTKQGITALAREQLNSITLRRIKEDRELTKP